MASAIEWEDCNRLEPWSRDDHDGFLDVDGNNIIAARAKFAWGGTVKGAIEPLKHGGGSLMECVVPWLCDHAE